MATLSRGQKQKLADLTPSLQLKVALRFSAPDLTFDFSCFGVDPTGKLSDDRYFVFYNQKSSPNSEITMSGEGDFSLDLSRLPASIQKLVFVATIDGNGTMANLKQGSISFAAGSSDFATFAFTGSDFGPEKAIMVAEIYLKDVWRLAAVGQGFAGGLDAVLKHFGGQQIEESNTPPAPPAPKISLNKDEQLRIKLEKSAPQLVNLSKTLAVSLQKKGLSEIVARVALVLDASGSMTAQYSSGAVQAVVDRIATLAMRLDDDGELDTWGFASRHEKLPVVTLSNVKGYIAQVTQRHSMLSIIGKLGVSNNEPPVMREILDTYRSSQLPAFVVFISDGGVGSSGEIKKVLMEASNSPIFWQFVGLGGSNYGILEDLDTMRGRAIDNANFFHVDDLNRISDDQLYDRLLNEFPKWLKDAKRAGILR
jgi:stress response protein SCP2